MNKNGLVLVLFIILIGLFNVTIIYLEKNKLVKDFININIVIILMKIRNILLL